MTTPVRCIGGAAEDARASEGQSGAGVGAWLTEATTGGRDVRLLVVLALASGVRAPASRAEFVEDGEALLVGQLQEHVDGEVGASIADLLHASEDPLRFVGSDVGGCHAPEVSTP